MEIYEIFDIYIQNKICIHLKIALENNANTSLWAPTYKRSRNTWHILQLPSHIPWLIQQNIQPSSDLFGDAIRCRIILHFMTWLWGGANHYIAPGSNCATASNVLGGSCAARLLAINNLQIYFKTHTFNIYYYINVLYTCVCVDYESTTI